MGCSAGQFEKLVRLQYTPFFMKVAALTVKRGVRGGTPKSLRIENVR